MAYLPVDFDLHDFQLSLDTMQSANFHKRLKELGFESNQQGDVLTYGRGKSRITAFVQGGSALNFLPDFFDDTPGGTVYAILEKLCVAFGGTMVGQYSVPSLGKTWDVRISQGMNLSGRPDVGQRDHVAEEDASTPSSGQQPTQHPGSQQKATQKVKRKPKPPISDGEVQEGQSGESSRDKLYRVLVEEAYAKHVEANGQDPSHFLELVKAFNQQFPKEAQETQKAPQIDEMMLDSLKDFLGLDNATNEELLNAIDHQLAAGYELTQDFADEVDIDTKEVESFIDTLRQFVKADSEDNDDLDDFFI